MSKVICMRTNCLHESFWHHAGEDECLKRERGEPDCTCPKYMETNDLCIRGLCGHPQDRHSDETCMTCDGMDGPFTGSCSGFQSEPSEAQLDALANATSFRETLNAAWEQKRMLDRG